MSYIFPNINKTTSREEKWWCYMGFLKTCLLQERGILSLNLFLKKKSSPEKRETLRKPSGFFLFFWWICLSSVWRLTLTHAHFCAISRLTTCLFLNDPFSQHHFPNVSISPARLWGPWDSRVFHLLLQSQRPRCLRDAPWTDGRKNEWLDEHLCWGRGVRGIRRGQLEWGILVLKSFCR